MQKPWLSRQRHGFLTGRRETVLFIGVAGLVYLAGSIWGVMEILSAGDGEWVKPLLGWVVFGGGSVFMLVMLITRYAAYRYESSRRLQEYGRYQQQTVTLNRHGVRWAVSGEPQRFYPWWQVRMKWTRRHVYMRLSDEGPLVCIELRDLRGQQQEQMRGWMTHPYRPQVRCEGCGHEVLMDGQLKCPKCGRCVSGGGVNVRPGDEAA